MVLSSACLLTVTPGEKWLHGKLEFMLSQRGKPLLVHDGYTFGIQYIRKDKKYWQCNLSRKFNCKARVTTTEAGDIIVTNNEHCHTEIRQHLRKEYKMNRQHNMTQIMLQQHALQMNLNRLSAVAGTRPQMHIQGQPQDQQQQHVAAAILQSNLNLGNNQNQNNNGNSSLERENSNNNDNNNGEGHHNEGDNDQQQHSSLNTDKDISVVQEEVQKRLPEWKEELLRSVVMREDLTK